MLTHNITSFIFGKLMFTEAPPTAESFTATTTRENPTAQSAHNHVLKPADRQDVHALRPRTAEGHTTNAHTRARPPGKVVFTVADCVGAVLPHLPLSAGVSITMGLTGWMERGGGSAPLATVFSASFRSVRVTPCQHSKDGPHQSHISCSLSELGPELPPPRRMLFNS